MPGSLTVLPASREMLSSQRVPNSTDMTPSLLSRPLSRGCLVAALASIPLGLHAQLAPGGLNNFVENALSPLEGKMEERVEQHEEASTVVIAVGTEPAQPFIDPRHMQVVDDLMSEMLVQENGEWFSQFLGSGIPVPIQFKEFQLRGPFAQPLTEKDKANGVQQKITYNLKSISHRHYRKPHGWGPWQAGNPIYFTGITVVKKAGQWEIDDSPSKNYSLLRKR